MHIRELVEHVDAVLGKRIFVLTVDEFAQLANMHSSTVRKTYRRGEMKGTQLGTRRGTIRIPLEELRWFIG